MTSRRASEDSGLTEATDEREEVGAGGLPSESQLVLLCLDYLRDLRRSFEPADLKLAEGLDADYLSVAIYALSRCFIRPSDLSNSSGNDAWLDRDKANALTPGLFPIKDPQSSANWIPVPNLATINQEILYPRNPNIDGSEVDVEQENWYEYDDSHESNAYRYFPFNGLASGPTIPGPLSLGEIATAGVTALGARTRLEAEREMMKSPLFDQFVSAVEAKGFFRDPANETPRENPEEEKARQARAELVYQERYSKVVGKFRTKLASKAQQQENDATDDLAISVLDRLRAQRLNRIRGSRRKRGIESKPEVVVEEEATPRKSQNEKMDPPEVVGSPSNDTATSVTKKVVPSSPSKQRVPYLNPVDLEEAERLKNVGNVQMQMKKYTEAADAYTAALKLSPGGPNAHVYFSNRAAAYISQKQFQEAILDSERSLALKPDYGKAHARLGLAHFLQGNYRQAMEAYTVSLKYEPDNKSSKNYLERAAKRLAGKEGGNDQAATSFSVVSEWDKSETVKSAHRLSIGAVSAGDIEDRKKLVDEKEAEKYKLKGNSFMASRDYQAALDAYSTAIKLCPSGPNSHVYYSNRAAALCYLEHYEQAEADSERSLALFPTYGKAHARLGLSRFFMGDYEGAVDAYTSALKYDPDNAASKSYLAKAKARLERKGSFVLPENDDPSVWGDSSIGDTLSLKSPPRPQAQPMPPPQGRETNDEYTGDDTLSAIMQNSDFTERDLTQDPEIQQMMNNALADGKWAI